MSLTRSLAAPAASLALLATLGLGGIAHAQDDTDVDGRAALCADLGANVDTPLADLSADLRSQIGALLGVTLGGDDERTPAQVLDCGEQPVDPPTDEPEPEPTEPPTTDTPAPPVTEPPVTEPPFVDRDCGDLGPGEAQALYDADPSDPHRLDRDGDGIPCEIEDLADEGANPDNADTGGSTVTGGSPTPGSGSNSQFEAMPSTAPETGRA